MILQHFVFLIVVFFVVRSTAAAGWNVQPASTEGPSLSIASVVVGKEAIFAGGFTHGSCIYCASPSANVDIFNSVNDSWTTGMEYPYEFSMHQL